MTIQCLYVFPSKEAIERLVTPYLALERSVKDYPFVGMNSHLYADVPKVISKLAGRELHENEFNTVLNQVVGLNSRVRELPEENY